MGYCSAEKIWESHQVHLVARFDYCVSIVLVLQTKSFSGIFAKLEKTLLDNLLTEFKGKYGSKGYDF